MAYLHSIIWLLKSRIKINMIYFDVCGLQELYVSLAQFGRVYNMNIYLKM